ncbi:S66 peptidase family protein [Leifsonia sp. NPDC102414]|uniref:S66 family peptidase n=1 Tax=Leifsonia sp. NPDC102414 TaxID=3364124 RepID=UPI003829F03E
MADRLAPSPLIAPPKLRPGDRVAVLSPSFAAPGFAPEVHEQAMRRLAEATGLVPVEFSTTRLLDASPEARAADLNAAFADPAIRAILATIGGDDQITVIPHLDAAAAVANPTIFLGYSDNTNILNWLWNLGIAAYYGGSTQVQLGAGPGIDDIHLAALLASLLDGGRLDVTDPGVSEDFGIDWRSPLALTEHGDREATEPWVWAGAEKRVVGPTWGGCIEVVDQLAVADRLPPVQALRGGILLLETSEEVPPARVVMRWVRALGERGVLEAVSAVLLARPPASEFGNIPSAPDRAAYRAEQSATVISEVLRYNPDAVVCTGVPFGHTRPQWILPYGGLMEVDGVTRRIVADYAGVGGAVSGR